MKKTLKFSIAGIFALFVIAAAGCSFSTANMSSLKTSKDKDGKQETTSYKAGDTIYARAAISNNPGKVKVKFSLTDPSGKAVSGSDVSIDLDGDGFGTYSMPTTPASPAGSYKLTADMINEAGEKKDSKSVTLMMVAGAAPATPSDANDSHETTEE